MENPDFQECVLMRCKLNTLVLSEWNLY